MKRDQAEGVRNDSKWNPPPAVASAKQVIPQGIYPGNSQLLYASCGIFWWEQII